MSGSTFGKNFSITTWGESHGKALGAVIDGCPAGISLCEDDIKKELNRRKPGERPFSSPRKENDKAEILSGVFDGKTTGTPISVIIYNLGHLSGDYNNLSSCFRPGHADFTFEKKYGLRDYRGGGRASGRETAGRVIGGAIAKKILSELGITVSAYVTSIGPIVCDVNNFDLLEASKNPFCMPDKNAAEEAKNYLSELIAKKDSAGGVVECRIEGLPIGLGEPVFDKFTSVLAHAIFSIGAVKGFEIGEGFKASSLLGSLNNDNFVTDESGKIIKATNNSGGVLGGITDGSDVIFRAAFKPTPSIGKEQLTVNNQGEPISLVIEGRHDPVIPPRAVVVVEAMTAITVLDLLFSNMFSNFESIKKFLE